MPSISMFYGLVVYLYYIDNKQHNVPHIHVKYQRDEAVFDILDGELLEGDIPKAKIRLIQAWIEVHREDLLTNWELALNGQTPLPIEPLR